MNWKEIPKIDAHIHILPQEVHDANPDMDDDFALAKFSNYQELMDQFNIRKAIIMPFNDPWLMSMDFTVDAVHKNLLEFCQKDDRFSCFADIDVRNTPEESCEHIRKALMHPQFRGIKIHPNNTEMNINDEYNDAIAAFAVENNYPIAIHSYPSSAREQDRGDYCTPARISRWMNRHPGLRVIICHLGGFQWEDAVGLDTYFDISCILPDLVSRYGLKKANEILREFGVERLLFGTDWPFSRSVKPAEIMEGYLDILDQMDFNEEEMHMIAHGNAEEFFKGERRL